ncbi:MAG: hypothetical protein CTY33_00475 [Methylotenera sp.]|nr:MAG: hypothetical protein CTY33_00475 [Methylotenera sp.]
MRSTKASGAVERLKRRSENAYYSLVISGNGLFSLALMKGNGESERLCSPMQLDDFVTFTNGYGAQTPKKLSKLDIEFSKQLKKSTG